MRSFIAALILLTIVVTVICINSLYVCNTTAELVELSKDIINEANSDKIKALCQKWEKSRPILEFSINESKISQMSDLIATLNSFHPSSQTREIDLYCRLIIDLCDELSQNEKLSLRGIF